MCMIVEIFLKTISFVDTAINNSNNNVITYSLIVCLRPGLNIITPGPAKLLQKFELVNLVCTKLFTDSKMAIIVV